MQKRLDLSQLMLYIASTSGNEDGTTASFGSISQNYRDNK